MPEASQHEKRFHHADWPIRGNVVRTGFVPRLPRAEFGFTLWSSPLCCHCMKVRFLNSSAAHKLTTNLSYSSGRFDSRDMKQIFVCVTPVALLQLAFAIPLTLWVLDNTMLACAIDDDTLKWNCGRCFYSPLRKISGEWRSNKNHNTSINNSDQASRPWGFIVESMYVNTSGYLVLIPMYSFCSFGLSSS